MKLSILLLIIATFTFAMSDAQYGKLYADKLITEFDKELNNNFFTFNNRGNILESAVYAKLLAARDIIEHDKRKSNEIISFDELEYNKIQKKIDKLAQEISFKIQNTKNNNSILYPSISGAGNLTGNTYPKDVWSITFDDGPHPTRTQKTVDNFYSQGVKLTYFMLTKNAEKLPHVLEYVLDAKMELALHSYTHLNLSSSSRTQAQLKYEIQTAKQKLEQLADKKINLFRLPYGAGMRNTSLRQRIADQNMIHVFWNVDTLDWQDKDPNSILARSLKQMLLTPKQGGIILFHDIHNQSVIASNLLLNVMQERGYTLCSVGDMVKYFNNESQDCL